MSRSCHCAISSMHNQGQIHFGLKLMMRMCEKSHPLGLPSESPLGNFESRRLLFEKGKRAHAFHRPGCFTPNRFDPDLRRTQPRSTGPFLPISIGSHRAALAAAIGSPCPYCGQTMQIPDPASKPCPHQASIEGPCACRQPRLGLLPLQH
jgi:hypothetical protein